MLLQPLMPPSSFSEHYYDKRYKRRFDQPVPQAVVMSPKRKHEVQGSGVAEKMIFFT
jgi:hypothetical protein